MYAQLAYMLGMGIGLLLMPNFVLSLLGISPASDNWIRVVGALALTMSLEYYWMIKQQSVPFFWASVWGRYLFCSLLIIIVTLGFVEKPVYALAALEIGLTIWTHLSLRKSAL